MDVHRKNKLIILKVICGQGCQQKDIQLDKPAMLIQHKMSRKLKQVPQEYDKNCQINSQTIEGKQVC